MATAPSTLVDRGLRRTRLARIGVLALGGSVALVAACGGDDAPAGSGSTSSSELALHAEAAPLPGFSYDTGLRPASGPAQMSLALTAGGVLGVDDVATVSGAKITAKPGSGKLKLDVHVKLTGKLKVKAGAVDYDGDVPGLSAIDVQIGNESTFDGFLFDGPPSVVTGNLPETKLPDVPLGSVPGHLALTLTSASTVTASYQGACMDVKAGKATYSGVATTSGTLVLKSQIVLEIPLLDLDPVDLPDVSVAIPGTPATLTSTPVDVAGVADGTTGNCATAAPAPATPTPTSTDDGGATDDGGTDGGDLRCSSKPTLDACTACCRGRWPGSATAFDEVKSACLAAHSADYCSSLDNLGCLDGDHPCTAFAECIRDEGCSSKP